MQTTSATWTQLWESGTAWLECKAIINGVEYTGIVPAINRALTQGGLSIGNAVAATCQFTIHTDNVIPKSAKVEIKKRLTDGTTSSEWLNAGTYFISRRTKDVVTGTISLECYDSMLKSNAVITDVPWTDSDGNVITTDTGEWIYFTTSYPRRMVDMAEDIALLLGVELDPRSQIKTGANYIINEPKAGETINDILRKIANANGGNWIISQDNKLWLVPVLSAADAEAATDNVIDVEGIVGNIGVNSVGVVTGVRYQSEDMPVILGDDTGIVLDVDDAGFAYELYDELIGIVYSSFSLNGAIYNPAAELGDYVRGGANGEIRSVLFSENCTLGMAFRGDISAQEAGEMDDEYPYMGRSDKVLIASKAYAQDAAQTATNALNESLNQEGIFNRLTNNGEAQGIYIIDGQVYVNMTYARSGTLVLGGLNNTNGVLQVLNASGNVIGSWNKDGITLKKGTITGPSITLGGSGNVNGTLAINNATGTTIGEWNNNGINIIKGSINIENRINDNYWNKIWLSDSAIDDAFKVIYSRGVNRITTIRYTEYGLYVNETGQAYHNGSTWVQGGQIDMISDTPRILLRTSGDDINNSISISFTSGIEYVDDNYHTLFSVDNGGNCKIKGNLILSGTKSRRVSTNQYSDRLLYCYETPSPIFGDVGEGTIGEDGLCYISLDAVFAQTITVNQYQVFLQRYGDGECWVKERKAGYFVVQGTPGLAFGWEVKAKQRDYDQLRLERADEPFTVPEQTYGQDAASYIEKLEKGRIPDEDSNKRNSV